MPGLDDCITKAGKALSSRDAIAIRKYRAANGGDELAAVQSFAADLDGQLEDIATMAEEQGAKVGRQDAGVNFEFAPNPDNEELAAQFNKLNPAQRREVTARLVNEFLPEIMIDLGITNWSYDESQGGFGNDVNPSIDLTVPDANMDQLVEIGDVVGYVASQQSIVAYDEHSSGTESDTLFVKLAPVTDMSYNEQAELYHTLHKADPKLIQGFSWRDGAMVLGNFTEFSDEQFYVRIEELIKPLDIVLNMTDSVFESRYENVTLEGTRYGNRDTNKSEAGRDVRGQRQGGEDSSGIEALKQRATERLRSEISRANPDRRAFRRFPPPGIREDGRVVLTHYSPLKDLDTIDPAHAGEGASGKELGRKSDPGYLNKSYYGLEGYQKERQTGTIKYTLSMDANDLYNLNEDPMGFKTIAENEPYSSTFLETLIKDAGFEGYWKQAHFGPTVALFNAQTPENMTDETGQVFYQVDKNDLGLYPNTAKAVEELKLPGWKGKPDLFTEADANRLSEIGPLYSSRDPNLQEGAQLIQKQRKAEGLVGGVEIWSKIRKTQGVTKEELNYLGLEEYLTGVPKEKFTRAEVAQFVKDNGIYVQETVGTEEVSEDAEGVDIRDWNEEIDDDSENWQGRADDFMYEFNQDEFDWMTYHNDISDVNEWFDEQYDDVGTFEELMGYLENLGTLTDEERTIVQTAYDESESVTDALMEIGITEPIRTNKIEREAIEISEMVAESEYMEDPYYTYSNEDYPTISITGSDDIGYHGSSRDGDTILQDVYSLDEVNIQLNEYLRDNDLLTSEDSENAAFWGDEAYNMEGEYENYREVKWAVPNIDGHFNESAHQFPENNIFAFTRVNDRELQLEPNRESNLEGVDLTGDKPPADMLIINEGSTFSEIEDNHPYKASRFALQWTTMSPEERATAYTTREDRSGTVNTYFIDEFQSDLHQTGRQFGYLTDDLEIPTQEQIRDARDKAGEALKKEDYLGFEDDHIAIATILIHPDFATRWEFTNPENAAIVQEYKRLRAIPGNVADMVPDAPFKGDAWIALGLKRSIVKAIENGSDAIAWPNAASMMDRWSPRYETLYRNLYDSKMSKAIKKITGQVPTLMGETGDAGELVPEVPVGFKVINEGTKEDGKWFVLDADGNKVYHEPASERHQATHTVKQAHDLDYQQGYWIIPITEEMRNQDFSLYQKGEGTTRGYYNPDKTLIRLTESSNATTFIHEFAHFMLDMERKSDSPRIEEINNWFKRNTDSLAEESETTITQVAAYLRNGTTGIEEVDVAIERATHEQFARGFEAYVMEGKAPSKTLRDAFRVFARLMLNVYRSLKGDLDVKVDDDMRQIFDRLLAVDESVEAATARARYTPLFTDAAMAGMTEEQFAKYKERLATSTDKATETLRDQIINELTRVRARWWNKEKADLIDEEFARLKTEPVYLARERLVAGDDVKMDRATAKEMLDIKAIPPALRNMTVTGGEGTHPDNAAMTYGFKSGQEMLEDIMTAPKQIDQATDNAEAEMLKRHGDIFNDGSIDTLADEAVRNEERGQMILEELRSLAKGTNTPTIDKGTLKDLAEQHIGKLSLSEIRPDRYRRAEIRSAQEAALALSKGEKDVALRAKTQQAMNFYLWKAAMDAREFGERMTKFAARYQKKALRQRIGKAGNGYLDQIDKILERFEFRKSVSMVAIDKKRQAIGEWFAERTEAGDNIAISDMVMADFRTHWKKIPMEEMRGLYETLLSIEHNSRESNKVRLGEEELEYEQLINRLLNSMSRVENRHTTQRTDVIEDTSELGFIKAAATKIHSDLVKIPWMMTALDNDERVGPMYRAFIQPFVDAYNNKIAMWKEVGTPIEKAIRNRSTETLKRHNTKYFFPDLVREPTEDNVDGHDGVLFGHQILAVALNMGNAGNLRKMLLGEGWATTEEEVSQDNPTLRTVVSKLTAEDWQFVDLIFKQVNMLKDDLARIHLEASGIPMETVKATPIETPFGTIEGGYYPVKYDSGRSKIAAKNEEKANENVLSLFNDGGFIMPQASTGARISRTEFTGPIRFSLDVVPTHIHDVVHFVTHYNAIKNVTKINSDARIEDAIRLKFGKDQQRQIKVWLNDIAKDGREVPLKLGYEKPLQKLRFGLTYGIMGFKASTGLIQISGLFNSAKEVGGKYLYRSIRKVMSSEQSIQEYWEFANSRSKVFNHRLESMDREIKNVMTQLHKKPSKLDPIKKASMMHIAYIQTYAVDLPSWHAAYEKGINDFEGDETRAIEYADFVVEQVQGSGLTKDLSGMQRNRSEFIQNLTMFQTFFSSSYNVHTELFRQIRDGKISSAAVVASLAFIWVLPGLYETLMREGLGDDDDEESLMERTMLGAALMPIATIPLMRDVISAKITGYGYNASPVGQAVGFGVDATLNPFSEDESSLAQYKGTSKLALAWFGVPGVNQAWISGEHLYDVMENGEDFSLRYLLVTTNKDK